MSPGLTPVTAGAVTALLLHTAPSCHWDYQVPLDTLSILARVGRAGQAAGCSAPLLLSIQGFLDFQGSAESSPPKVLGIQGARVEQGVLCP